MWRKGKSLTLLVGMSIGTAAMENNMQVLKKLKLELPYDPAIPLLVTYMKKTIIRKNVSISMSFAVPFTIAKTLKQCKCPWTEKWIKKMWYIYTMEYYSAIKSNEIMPFAAIWMDLESVIWSEVSQTEEKYHMTSLICGI